MSSYNRYALAVDLSLRLAIPIDRAKGVIDQTIDALTEALVGGRKVEFRDFGILEVVRQKQKVGRNPANPTGGNYLIPARNKVRFRTGNKLFNRLNPQ